MMPRELLGYVSIMVLSSVPRTGSDKSAAVTVCATTPLLRTRKSNPAVKCEKDSCLWPHRITIGRKCDLLHDPKSCPVVALLERSQRPVGKRNSILNW
jgi:hypothetical protein